MHVTLRLIFLILALVFFVLAALGVQAVRINLTGAGLACLVMSMIVV